MLPSIVVQDTVCDLGVVVDSRLSFPPTMRRSATEAAPIVSLAPTTCPICVRGCSPNTSPGIHFLSPELLELSAFWHDRRSDSTGAVGSERCRQARHWPRRLVTSRRSFGLVLSTGYRSAEPAAGRQFGASIIVRWCSAVHCRRLSPCRRCPSTAITVCRC